MELGLDRKVFNVESNIAAAGGSARTDLLRNLPSVTVDLDGNVSLRGSQNVRFLVNGRPSGLTSGDPATFLQSLSAANVERIEVITNPGAGFDPEGTAGLINIVLKRERADGLNGSATLNVGTNDKYERQPLAQLPRRCLEPLPHRRRALRRARRRGLPRPAGVRRGRRAGVGPPHHLRRLPPKHRPHRARRHRVRLLPRRPPSPSKAPTSTARARPRTRGASASSTAADELTGHERARGSSSPRSSGSTNCAATSSTTSPGEGHGLSGALQYGYSGEEETENYDEDVFRRGRGLPRAHPPKTPPVDEERVEILAQLDYERRVDLDGAPRHRRPHRRVADHRRAARDRRRVQRLRRRRRPLRGRRFVQQPLPLRQRTCTPSTPPPVPSRAGGASASASAPSRPSPPRPPSPPSSRPERFDNDYFELYPSVYVGRDLSDDLQAQVSYSRRINRPPLAAAQPLRRPRATPSTCAPATPSSSPRSSTPSRPTSSGASRAVPSPRAPTSARRAS